MTDVQGRADFETQDDASENKKASTPPIDLELLRQVIDVVRPSLQADGGDCSIADVSDDGVVTLELTGACSGCPLTSVTLGLGIERILKEHVPGVTGVLSIPGDPGSAFGGPSPYGMGSYYDPYGDDYVPLF